MEVIDVTKFREIASIPFYFAGTIMIVSGTWLVWIGMQIFGSGFDASGEQNRPVSACHLAPAVSRP
jgi:hypothetical protein